METLLHERLRQLASNSSAAYNALWTRLDHLGMRVNGNNGQSAATQHRLTKDGLKALFAPARAMLIPPMNIAEVRKSFNTCQRQEQQIGLAHFQNRAHVFGDGVVVCQVTRRIERNDFADGVCFAHGSPNSFNMRLARAMSRFWPELSPPANWTIHTFALRLKYRQ